jgi:hypothetical protein
MIELGKLFLPLVLDYSMKRGTITFRMPEYGTVEYIEDSECYLQITFSGDIVDIDYYCEDDALLSDILDLDNIATGNIKQEKFETIQSRALQCLSKYLDESQQELLEHFGNI